MNRIMACRFCETRKDAVRLLGITTEAIALLVKRAGTACAFARKRTSRMRLCRNTTSVNALFRNTTISFALFRNATERCAPLSNAQSVKKESVGVDLWRRLR